MLQQCVNMDGISCALNTQLPIIYLTYELKASRKTLSWISGTASCRTTRFIGKSLPGRIFRWTQNEKLAQQSIERIGHDRTVLFVRAGNKASARYVATNQRIYFDINCTSHVFFCSATPFYQTTADQPAKIFAIKKRHWISGVRPLTNP